MGDKNKKKVRKEKQTQEKTLEGKQENSGSSPSRDEKKDEKKDEKNLNELNEKTFEEPSKETTTVEYQRESKKSKIKVKAVIKINNQPLDPSSDVVKCQKVNKGHDVDKFLATYPQYSMYGENIPIAEESFLAEIEESKLKTLFNKGYVFRTADMKSYTVLKPSGRRNMYYVVSEQNFVLVLKVESLNTKPRDSFIKREVVVRLYNREVKSLFQNHILDFVGIAVVPNVCNFLIMHLARRDLVDLRGKLGNSVEYLPKDAVRINIQTLQAIHDVHLCRFIHRDIHPRNFKIGLYQSANVVYVFNFGLSYEYRPKSKHLSILAKLAKLSRTFQPRVFHTGLEYNCLSDIESWLYMCYWMFNGTSLPWRREFKEGSNYSCEFYLKNIDERKMCNAKDLFFHGLYDHHFHQILGPPVCKYLNAMRQKIKTETVVPSPGHVNYSFYGEVLLTLAKELGVDWKEPYQWQDYIAPAPGVKPKLENPQPSDINTVSANNNEKTGGGNANAPIQSAEKAKKKKEARQDTHTEDEETRNSSSSSAQTTEKSNFDSKLT